MYIDRIERLFRRLQPLVVPEEPGVYLDYEGSAWRLHDDGRWEDAAGELREVDSNWMLVAAAPFYRVEGIVARTS